MTKAMSKLDGVKEVFYPRAVVNAFVVEADVPTLIDTGTPGGAKRLLAAARAAGHEPQSIGRILLTHRHADHASNAAELAEATGAEVHVSPVDAPWVTQGIEQSKPKVATLLGRVLVPYVAVALPWKLRPVAAQTDLVEGARVGPFRVLETPGHTAGHVSLLWEERGILFTGDAAAHLTTIGPHPASDDPTTATASFERLAGETFEAACFGHGRAIASGAAQAFRAAAS